MALHYRGAAFNLYFDTLMLLWPLRILSDIEPRRKERNYLMKDCFVNKKRGAIFCHHIISKRYFTQTYNDGNKNNFSASWNLKNKLNFCVRIINIFIFQGERKTILGGGGVNSECQIWFINCSGSNKCPCSFRIDCYY